MVDCGPSFLGSGEIVKDVVVVFLLKLNFAVAFTGSLASRSLHQIRLLSLFALYLSLSRMTNLVFPDAVAFNLLQHSFICVLRWSWIR